jgi:glycosyltransferase involved in cell wall biosynthesis
VVLVSIVLPVYNRDWCLDRCLKSLENQTFKDFELIICVDKPSMRFYSIVCEYIYRGMDIFYRLSYIKRGVPAARNAGITAARGRYIAFIDSDDTWPCNKLQEQVDHLESNSYVGLLYGKCRYVKDDHTSYTYGTSPDHLDLFDPAPFSTVIVKRELCLLQDTRLSSCDDYEWLLRMRDIRVPIQFVSKIWSHNYIHHDNLSTSKNTQAGLVKMWWYRGQRLRAIYAVVNYLRAIL